MAGVDNRGFTRDWKGEHSYLAFLKEKGGRLACDQNGNIAEEKSKKLRLTKPPSGKGKKEENLSGEFGRDITREKEWGNISITTIERGR